jgi:hypothetical protein
MKTKIEPSTIPLTKTGNIRSREVEARERFLGAKRTSNREKEGTRRR